MVRKHCGKRRNCSSRAISPFPTVFSKGLYCRHVKTRACLGKGLQRSLLKTLVEQEKMLITGIFFFSHKVSYQPQNIFHFLFLIAFILLFINALNIVQDRDRIFYIKLTSLCQKTYKYLQNCFEE